MNNNGEMKGCENPREIFSSFRENGKSLHVEAHFSKAEESEYPLAVFGRFARLVFTVIDKNDSKRKYCAVNMQYDKIAGFLKRGAFALEKYLSSEITGVSEATDGTSPAYTVRMTTGKYKGMTVAEIIARFPDCIKELNSHYEFLAENAEKYPANKRQMEAISDAAEIMKNGGSFTSSEAGSTAPFIRVFDPVPLPQVRKTREDGLSPVAELEVICDCSKNAPFEFTISNYFAPVQVDEIGKMKAIKSQMQDFVKHSFSISVEEWCDLVDKISIAKDVFLFGNGISQLKLSDQWFEKNRQKIS